MGAIEGKGFLGTDGLPDVQGFQKAFHDREEWLRSSAAKPLRGLIFKKCPGCLSRFLCLRFRLSQPGNVAAALKLSIVPCRVGWFESNLGHDS